jgi:hypothetical protein
MNAFLGLFTRFSSDMNASPCNSAAGRESKNGTLLRLAESEFNVFITSDQSLRYQQNLTGFRVAILQLSTNKLNRIIQAGVLVQSAVGSLQPGEFRVL